MKKLTIAITLWGSALLASCAASQTGGAQRPLQAGASMPVLEGEDEIAAFAKAIAQSAPPVDYYDGENIVVTGSAIPPPPPVAVADLAAEPEAAASEKITNVQEQGVDEGGIVKVAGNYLVVLRRGRIFSLRHAGNMLDAIDHIDAFPPGDDDPSDTWYDEMLTSGSMIITIGYSYGDAGTEISRFDIDQNGKFTYRDTHYLTSADYYSSRNYASRLIGTNLVLYAPIPVNWTRWQESLPTVQERRSDGELGNSRRHASGSRLFVPRQHYDHATRDLRIFHTVSVCRLAEPGLPCDSTMVVGPWGRDFYIARDAAWVWTDEVRYPGDDSDFDNSAMLYRIPLDGSQPTAIGTVGSPVDQFSFREDYEEGRIDILLRGNDYGGGMWGGEFSSGDVSLLSLPVDRLGDGSRLAPRSLYRDLPEPNGYRFQNRFVGNHVLYSASQYGDEDETPEIIAVPLDKGWVESVALPHGVTRIDVLGKDAIAIGPDADDRLGFSSIALDGESGAAQLEATHLMPSAEEGENRSQAFFFRPDRQQDGVSVNGTLGLPVNREVRDDAGEFLGDASAIAYLRRENRALSELGTLDSGVTDRDDADAIDNCEASCVDWYGNARPIFLGDRVFALMGYELVEGRIEGGRINELRRIDFTPRAVARD